MQTRQRHREWSAAVGVAMSWRTVSAAILALGLAGCGGEVVGTAATSAAIKKQEIEQGNKTANEMKKQITQSMEQSNSRAREGDK